MFNSGDSNKFISAGRPCVRNRDVNYNARRRNSGFTLVEVVVTIGIIDTFLYDDTSYEEYEKQEELMEDENHEETKSTIPSEKGTHHVEDH